jgi:hypothetical protein
MPSGNPGKFSTSVVMESCPPRLVPFENQRFQIRPSGVDRSSVAGTSRAKYDDVSHE